MRLTSTAGSRRMDFNHEACITSTIAGADYLVIFASASIRLRRPKPPLTWPRAAARILSRVTRNIVILSKGSPADFGARSHAGLVADSGGKIFGAPI
jgi:hypothetical protein